MVDAFAQDRQYLRRRFGLGSIPASLGDANGVIYTPGRPGFYEVRIATGLNSDGSPRFSQSASVRLRLGVSLTITPGAAIWLNYDENGELVITGGNGAAQEQQGINPIQQNPLDPFIQGKVNQTEILTLNSNPVTPPDTLVYIKAWPVIANGIMYVFPGGTIDLGSFIPAAGEHCICAVGVQDDYATLEAFASTAKATTDPIDLVDYQEAIDGLTAGSTPAWFYRLHDDQAQIVDEDKWLDIRQMINIGSSAGTGIQISKLRVHTAAGAVTVSSTDYIVVVNKTSGAATTVNLPSSPATGRTLVIKDGKGDCQTNNITLTPASGNIDGEGTFVMRVNYAAITLVYSGTEWSII